MSSPSPARWQCLLVLCLAAWATSGLGACATFGRDPVLPPDSLRPRPTAARALPLPCREIGVSDRGLRVIEADADCQVPGLPRGANLALFATLTSGDEPAGLSGLGAALSEVSIEAAPSGARTAEETLASVALAHAAEVWPVGAGGRVGWALRLSDPAAAPALLTALVGLASELRPSSNLVATWAERRGLHTPEDGAARAWAGSIAAGLGWPVAAGITRPLLSRLHREDLVRLHRRLFVQTRLTVVIPRGASSDTALGSLSALPDGEGPDSRAPCAVPLRGTFHVETRVPAPTLHAAAPPAPPPHPGSNPPRHDRHALAAARDALVDRLDAALAGLRPIFEARGGSASIDWIDGTPVLVADTLALSALQDLLDAAPPVLPELLGPYANLFLGEWLERLRVGVTVVRSPDAPDGAVTLPRSPRPLCTSGDAATPRHPRPARITLQDGTTGVISVPNFKAKPGEAPARARANHDAHREDEANR